MPCRGLLLAGIACILLQSGGGQSAAPPAYAPVASPAALNSAVGSNLKLVRHSFGEKDFVSAAEATKGLTLVIQLYGSQSTEPNWRKRIAVLEQACSRLVDSVRRRDLAACGVAGSECDRLLADLAKSPPPQTKANPNFKPFGTNKVWMLLLEGAYVDAKRAETAKELEQISQTIAEEVGMVGRLRSDARWQASAGEVQTAALQVARLAAANDLPAARKGLKEIYRRCEICHQRDKR